MFEVHLGDVLMRICLIVCSTDRAAWPQYGEPSKTMKKTIASCKPDVKACKFLFQLRISSSNPSEQLLANRRRQAVKHGLSLHTS